MEKYKVFFQPQGESIEVFKGTTVMQAMRDIGIDFDFPCGGEKKCGKCRVRILGEIQLACFTEVHSDMAVETFSVHATHHKTLLSVAERAVEIEPHITKKYVAVKKPSLGEHQSEWKHFIDAVYESTATDHTATDRQIPILQKLPQMLRANSYQLTAVTQGSEVLDIEAADTTKLLLGMAFDIGTTTIVGYLVDLYTGRELCVVSTINPQVKFGADVITRSNYAAGQENDFKLMHDVLMKAMNQLIAEATEKSAVSSEAIYVVTVVGNTCMHHLFLGLTPQYISKAPYIPTISQAIEINAANFSIAMNKSGKILVLPNIAGFVGADTVGVLLATEMKKYADIKLMIDIGTNGEIALGSKDRLFTCSAAAGPAFEGAQISSGMRGAVGAIDHIIFGEKLEYSVIGGGRPQGLCGSGLLDGVAGLVQLGMIDKRGRFLSPEKITNPKAAVFKRNIIEHHGEKAFLLVDHPSTSHGNLICITQKDIRELQVAKGAIAAGIKILIEKYGIKTEDITEVLLAGAFGNYLNPSSACRIGLIPKELEGKIKMVGNAAGTGAKIALLSATEYKEADAIAAFVEFIELASDPNFSTIFARSTYFSC
ncbi:ferredoxin [Alkaliphilus metalliredigens QYMF]|uniref:Ferredoxin n=1 Tax=Alkaliphilus metalliredigens (strain QYMF) TaxID=293826 RepID=A6TPZ1_ALKMQ|nr:ASKHA domain-containing protein [Alkaliphilus metalliredigens]ABR48259.1 ferredoxin [Alkaliphilus metalliredigens QYMF]